jgi:hypothetical protein
VESGTKFGVAEASVSTRRHKCRALERGTRDQDLLIFGSSTANFARTRIALEAGYRPFNLSVGSADPIDVYCLLRFALEQLRLPLRRIVVCLDIFSLKPRSGALVKDRLLEVPALVDYLMPEERDALPLADRAELHRRLKLAVLRIAEWAPSFRHTYDVATGDIINLDRAAADQERPYRFEDAPRLYADTVSSLQGFDRLCPRRVAYLQAISAIAAERGIVLSTVAMSFHRGLASHLVATTQYPARRREMLAMLRQVAPGGGVHDVGFDDRVGGDPDDFIDPSHPGPVNMIAVLRHVLSQGR